VFDPSGSGPNQDVSNFPMVSLLLLKDFNFNEEIVSEPKDFID
jgi:hypothetical protein